MTVTPVLAPFYSLLRREIGRFLKVAVQTILTPLITTTLYLLIFGVSLGANIQLASGVSYLAFLIPGLLMMSVLNNSFQNSSSSVVSGKFSGDLEDLKVVPLSPQQILWAISFGGLLRGLTVGLVTLVVGELFYYFSTGSFLPIANGPVLVVFLIIGGICFAQLGLAVAFWAKTFDQMAAVGAFLLTPLIYLGGVFFSIEGLNSFWRGVSLFNPLLYFINGVRWGVLGVSDVSVIHALGVSLISLVVFQSIALYSLKHGEYSRW